MRENERETNTGPRKILQNKTLRKTIRKKPRPSLSVESVMCRSTTFSFFFFSSIVVIVFLYLRCGTGRLQLLSEEYRIQKGLHIQILSVFRDEKRAIPTVLPVGPLHSPPQIVEHLLRIARRRRSCAVAFFGRLAFFRPCSIPLQRHLFRSVAVHDGVRCCRFSAEAVQLVAEALYVVERVRQDDRVFRDDSVDGSLTDQKQKVE